LRPIRKKLPCSGAWNKVSGQVALLINGYNGGQYVNEKGLSISDLQDLTDHARLDSVRKYAAVSVARKRELMARGSVPLRKIS